MISKTVAVNFNNKSGSLSLDISKGKNEQIAKIEQMNGLIQEISICPFTVSEGSPILEADSLFLLFAPYAVDSI